MSVATYIDKLVMQADAQGFGPAQLALGGLTTAAGLMAGAGLTAGKEWDTATKTIVEGTGATGEALAGLQESYQAVAQFGPDAATAVADLNTHLGLTGPALELVAEKALKAKINTNEFGGVAAQLGLDSQGAAELLDDLVVASQNTGVEVDTLVRTIGKASSRWQTAGGKMDDLVAITVQAADEFGPAGLRGAMSEVLSEVDKGVIPAVTDLETQLGETTGAVERTYEAGRTWRDVLAETKDDVLAQIGPYGDLIGAMGTVSSTTLGFLTAFPGAAAGVTKGARLMWGALGGPIGLVVLGIGSLATAWVLWGDKITAFLGGAWNKFVGTIEGAIDWLRPFADKIGIDLPENLGTWKVSTEDVTESTEKTKVAVDDVASAADIAAAGSIPSLTMAMGGPAGKTGAAKAAETLTEKFKRLKIEGIKSFEDLSREAQEIWTNKISRTLTKVATNDGLNASAAFSAGFLGDGPGGMATALPDGITKIALDAGVTSLPSFEDSGLKTSAAFGEEFMSKLQGVLGGGEGGTGIVGFFQGAMGGVSGVLSQFLNGDWKSTLGSMVSMGLNTVVPGLGTIANQAFAAFKNVWDWFKKPSETELAARGMWGNIHDTVVDKLRASAEFSNEVSIAMKDGWDRETAEMRAAFVLLGQQAGLTYDEAFGEYAKYEQAVRDGNVELMRELEGNLVAWEGQAKESAGNAADSINDEMGTVKTDYSINWTHNVPPPPSFSDITRTINYEHGEGAELMSAGGYGRVGTQPKLFVAEPGEAFWFSGVRNQVPFPGSLRGAAGGGDIVVHAHLNMGDVEDVAEEIIRVDPRVRDRLYGGGG